jgi:GNAT superfamily N-acetyltransferase
MSVTVRTEDTTVGAADPIRADAAICDFVAVVDGKDVARLTASIDRRHGDGRCGLGHLDWPAEVGVDVVGALVDAAAAWAKGHGGRYLIGPVNEHTLRGYRAMVHGFEREPFPFEPRNPPHIPARFLACGFREDLAWRTWDIGGLPLWLWRQFHRFQSRRNEQLRAQGYGLRDFDLARFDDELVTLHRLVFACYGENWGMVPVSFAEYAAINEPLRGMTNLRGVFLTLTRDGVASDIGFGLAQDCGSVGVLHSFGILKEHRGKGLAHLIYQKVFDEMAVRSDVTHVIGALAKEGSTKYRVAGKPSRRYVLFRKELS